MLTSNALSFLGTVTIATAAGILPALSPLSAIPSPTTVPSVDLRPGWRRILLCGVFGFNLLFAAGEVSATEPVNDEARKCITATVSAGLQMLNDTRYDQGQRESRGNAPVRRSVDAGRATRFVLGRYWNAATDSERRRFAEVYSGYIAHTYAKALPYLNGATIKVVRTSEMVTKLK